jgi:hypothetical protein
MNSPFKFGNLVNDIYFINRKIEISRLQNNFQSGNNTILISPRRWGKSSLVAMAAKLLNDSNIKFVFLNIGSERTIYNGKPIVCNYQSRKHLTAIAFPFADGYSDTEKSIPFIP